MSQRHARLIAGIYQVGQSLSSGPLLTSYSAYNRNTNDVVGLLVIQLPPAFDPSAAQLLLAPLANRRQIQSPHVMRVYDWGVFEGTIYIATDPPRGISLRQLAEAEHIDLVRTLDLAIQLTRGVAVLQANGIADIDLRPQLITVDTIGLEDRVQVDDVGLRVLLRQLGYMQGQSITDIGHLDPRYMAPEHIYQGTSGAASDVYQLGIVLFELITGRPPFVGRTPAETGIMQGNSPVPRMVQLKHEMPLILQTIVDRALAKDPQQRYPHATDLLAALEAVPVVSLQRASGTWQATAQMGTAPTKSADLTTEMTQITAKPPLDADETLVADKQALREQAGSSAQLPQDATIYAYLDYERDGKLIQRLPIKDTYAIVGRLDPKRGIAPEIDLTALDPLATVSRQHARIRFEKTFFYIEDLKSRNKTRLGELVLTPLKPELLQHGDVVRFGSLKTVFRLPDTRDKPTPKNLA